MANSRTVHCNHTPNLSDKRSNNDRMSLKIQAKIAEKCIMMSDKEAGCGGPHLKSLHVGDRGRRIFVSSGQCGQLGGF